MSVHVLHVVLVHLGIYTFVFYYFMTNSPHVNFRIAIKMKLLEELPIKSMAEQLTLPDFFALYLYRYKTCTTNNSTEWIEI